MFSINTLLMMFVIVLWILVILNFVKNFLSSIKEVSAEVIDKYKAESSLRYRGFLKGERYIVVFFVKDKKISFSVSEFSYNNYKIDQKGTLKYKGRRLMDFS